MGGNEGTIPPQAEVSTQVRMGVILTGAADRPPLCKRGAGGDFSGGGNRNTVKIPPHPPFVKGGMFAEMVALPRKVTCVDTQAGEGGTLKGIKAGGKRRRIASSFPSPLPILPPRAKRAREGAARLLRIVQRHIVQCDHLLLLSLKLVAHFRIKTSSGQRQIVGEGAAGVFLRIHVKQIADGGGKFPIPVLGITDRGIH